MSRIKKKKYDGKVVINVKRNEDGLLIVLEAKGLCFPEILEVLDGASEQLIQKELEKITGRDLKGINVIRLKSPDDVKNLHESIDRMFG